MDMQTRIELPPLDVTKMDYEKADDHYYQGWQGWPHFHCRERQLLASLAESSRLAEQVEKLSRKIAIIFDQSCYSDDLGVEGSGFDVCRWCGGGSSPGKENFKHNDGCLMDDAVLEKQVGFVWEQEEPESDDVWDINHIANYACGTLADGWSIELSLERGSGAWTLYNDNGDEVDIPGSSYGEDDLKRQLLTAVGISVKSSWPNELAALAQPSKGEQDAG